MSQQYGTPRERNKKFISLYRTLASLSAKVKSIVYSECVVKLWKRWSSDDLWVHELTPDFRSIVSITVETSSHVTQGRKMLTSSCLVLSYTF